jgi:hypothetical protein
MNVRALKSVLRQSQQSQVRFVLPDGDTVPAEFHVTEVGHVKKNFIDCGGTVRSLESCLLQAWVSENDREHRLTGGKLAKILDLSGQVVPSEELDVEVEYDCGVVAQYTVDSARVQGDELHFALGNKRTDCLARESCGVDDRESGCGCGDPAGAGKCC